MNNLFKKMMFGLISVVISVSAFAQKSTPEQAQALVKSAIAYYKEVGKEKAVAEFNSPTSKFKKGDLYVFVYTGDGTSVAHSNPKMVGKNLIDLRDRDGKYINKEFFKLGDSKDGSGWQEYAWPDPVSKEVATKRSYVEKFDNLYFIAGAYK